MFIAICSCTGLIVVILFYFELQLDHTNQLQWWRWVQGGKFGMCCHPITMCNV